MILDKLKKTNKNFYPILFYGNESGLISDLINSIHDCLEERLELGEIRYFDNKTDSIDVLKSMILDPSLLSKSNFVVVKNPQKNLLKEIESLVFGENILIINGENIQTKSEIKSVFEKHANFIAVPCYQLDKNFIKKTIDDFINNHEIQLEKEAYWFLIENINDDYLSLKNELEKILNYNKNSLTLSEIQKLIVQKNNTNIDSYFFYCVTGNSKEILHEMNRSIKSISESYEILVSIKRFINILSNAIVNKEKYSIDVLTNMYLPKYLFKKKEIFKESINKNDINKISQANKMIQKTENLIRINSDQHKEVLERFLLNLAKTIS